MNVVVEGRFRPKRRFRTTLGSCKVYSNSVTVGDVLLYLGQMFQITDSLLAYVGIAHQELVLTSLLPSTIFWLCLILFGTNM